jgi:serine-type D-Ala-D-Ala carboxypeptidase (penicillin-binding protein 5/6)
VSSDRVSSPTSSATSVVPIGSIAKVMTALLVLNQKPLTRRRPGPEYTITGQDVGLLRCGGRRATARASRSPSGEQFTERQLLLALLLPSANNIAETLAVWVAGSQSAFIAELNT